MGRKIEALADGPRETGGAAFILEAIGLSIPINDGGAPRKLAMYGGFMLLQVLVMVGIRRGLVAAAAAAFVLGQLVLFTFAAITNGGDPRWDRRRRALGGY